jgi:4-hydroxybenzoate polyprenyltransferase
MSLSLFVGIVAMGVDPREQPLLKQISILALYFALVTWTVIYDTIYACQDSKDNAQAGVKSLAVRFLPWIRPLLWGCAAVKLSLLVACGIEAGFSGGYFLSIVCGGVALSLTTMIWTVNLDDPINCLWWFKNTYWQVAIPLSAGFLAEYASSSNGA